MSIQLKPIQHKRIADQVFDQLQELILRGDFKPGDKFMTERELARVFQVSRISVRDAISKLVVMRMLEQRQGQGTFVSRPAGKIHAYMTRIMESQNATIQDLLELGMGFECNAAALAAQRARQSDIVSMGKCLNESESEMQAGRLGSDTDNRFHMAIACAGYNPLQVFFMKQFHEFLACKIKQDLFVPCKKSRTLETNQQQHRNIVNAIKARDPMRAYMATKQHVEFVILTVAESGKIAT